jgi:YD repeat-containing protein
MKVSYDAETDTLTVVFRDVPIAESDEDKPGVILDYDAAGNLVSIEVLDASKRVDEPRSVTLAAVARPRYSSACALTMPA